MSSLSQQYAKCFRLVGQHIIEQLLLLRGIAAVKFIFIKNQSPKISKFSIYPIFATC
jgi:hypothetical protein